MAMKFCQSHWDRLRAEIKTNSLDHMVLDSSSMVKKIVNELEGRPAAFDPLMAMHNEIIARFLEPLGDKGLYIFTGDYCPLCELDRLNPGRELAESWIVKGTKDLAEYCRENNVTDEILDADRVEPEQGRLM